MARSNVAFHLGDLACQVGSAMGTILQPPERRFHRFFPFCHVFGKFDCFSAQGVWPGHTATASGGRLALLAFLSI
jgi:hypothetical protein